MSWFKKTEREKWGAPSALTQPRRHMGLPAMDARSRDLYETAYWRCDLRESRNRRDGQVQEAARLQRSSAVRRTRTAMRGNAADERANRSDGRYRREACSCNRASHRRFRCEPCLD